MDAFYWTVLVTCALGLVFDAVQLVKAHREHKQFMKEFRERWRHPQVEREETKR